MLTEIFECCRGGGLSLFGNQPDKDYCARLCLSRQKYVSKENKFRVYRTLSKLRNNCNFWKLICPCVLNSTFKMMRNYRLPFEKNKLDQIQDRCNTDELLICKRIISPEIYAHMWTISAVQKYKLYQEILCSPDFWSFFLCFGILRLFKIATERLQLDCITDYTIVHLRFVNTRKIFFTQVQ